MTDPNEIETQLRHHLARRADGIDATPAVGGGLVIREAARRRSASRHRRRMATASVLTVAAVTAGLIVIARQPADEDVRTKRDQAAGAPTLAAGSATGSSTGSATGSPRGWDPVTASASLDGVLPDLSLTVDPSYQVISNDQRSIAQGSTGMAAAALAVAADLRPGQPARFIVASVQDADRLSSGRDGATVTIAGRPGRVISKRAATTLTWDVSDDQRVLVVAAGVDDATLVDWLSGLSRGADGTWAFDPSAGGGLEPVATTTVTAQASRTISWNRITVGPDATCETAGYGLTLTSGGAYEFWATIAESTRWAIVAPTVVSATIPGAAGPSPALVSEWGGVLALDGDAVIQVDHWDGRGTSTSAVDAPALLDLLVRGGGADLAPAAGADDQAIAPESATKSKAGIAAGTEAPPATAPPTTMPPAGA